MEIYRTNPVLYRISLQGDTHENYVIDYCKYVHARWCEC